MTDYDCEKDLSYYFSELNTTYIELVGTMNDMRGKNSSMSLIFIACSAGLIVASIFLWGGNNPFFLKVILFIGVLFGGIFLAVSIHILRFDSFNLTQYSVRVNRRSKFIYIHKPDRSFVSWSWSDIELVVVVANGRERMLSGPMAALHVNLLDKITGDIVDSAPIASDLLARTELLEDLKSIISRFMDGSFDYENLKLDFYSPGSQRREGLKFGIIHAFYPCRSPLMKLFASPVFSTFVLGRWFAMYTSKLPEWPSKVLDACIIYDKGKAKRFSCCYNSDLSFSEATWPFICFFIGLIIDFIAGFYFLCYLSEAG